LKNACNLISNNFTNELRNSIGREALDISTLEKVDLVLLKYFRHSIVGDKKLGGPVSSQMNKTAQSTNSEKPLNEDGVGLNLVRACSEAVWNAVAKTLAESENGLIEVFAQHLNPSPKFKKLRES
jgi:hypothetical protein